MKKSITTKSYKYCKKAVALTDLTNQNLYKLQINLKTNS